MSIFNMIASIVGGGGGGTAEIETGSFTGDSNVQQRTITFTNTHTTPPDIVTISLDDFSYEFNSPDLTLFHNEYLNLHKGNFPAMVDENGNPYDGVILADKSFSAYGDNSSNMIQIIPQTVVEQFGVISSTGFVVSGATVTGFPYSWEAIWLDGSGGGGGGGTVNLQAKTHIGASTSSQTITADTGYDGLSSVQIDPVSQTNLIAGNIKSGTTVSISNGTSNLWSVTGTYSGGSSKNVQTNQTTSRTSSTSLTSVNSLTCSTAGTYDVYWTCDRSSTNGTWSSQLYLGGTAYGSEQTAWSNHVQTVHLSNVTISANQTVAVYVKARGTNYYGYAPQLTIVQS